MADPRILLVDDEAGFRARLATRLRARGYLVDEADSGEDAVKLARRDPAVEVVVLDQRMPGMDGFQTLAEIKAFRPALQAIMLTGHGSVASARTAGTLDAFRYLQKPCPLEQLIEAIDAGLEEAVRARARHEMPVRQVRPTTRSWLLGSHGSRPLFILLGLLLLGAAVAAPAPARLLKLVGTPRGPAAAGADDPVFGYAEYRKMRPGQTIAAHYSEQYGLGGRGLDGVLSPEQVAFRAKLMLGLVLMAATFWATGAVPVAVTALMVGVAMYLFGVFRPDGVAAAFAKDAVVFIFGVLALSRAINKTGLDRRIGLLLLAPARSLNMLLLGFLPLLSLACSFISEHALVAFLMPLFVMIYGQAVREAGLKRDRSLMVMLALSLCFAANSGGPGSPAAGGRNAIMIGILADYNLAPSFGQWVSYGLPMVPVLSLAVALYFLAVVRPRVKVGHLDAAAVVRRAAERLGGVTGAERVTAAVLLLVIALWITSSGSLGMGGPVILGLVLLNLMRVLTWRDMVGIHWEVVLLYAGAAAMGKGLAATGGALFLADTFVGLLPASLASGPGLAIASSLFTGLATNFMSDGATVAALGPITVPMATVAGVHPWSVGLATAFASSFAHMLVIGTPSNALAFAMARDPVTGEQLLTLGDFMKHGAAVLVISFAVLWGWVILGYWQWLGFPGG